MLIAVALTLVLMGTVASIFASVSGSIANRRSSMEMNTQLAHVRNVLASDLRGATCTALPWQRPEASQGYFEIVEGLYCDFYPSALTDGIPGNGELEVGSSTIPTGLQPGSETVGAYVQNLGGPNATASNGLGDYDDILAFTTRNESEPFVGRVPQGNRLGDGSQENFSRWGYTTSQSPLAEVIWFAVENPPYDTGGLMGEAGFRTIYRRALIIAPWLDYSYSNYSATGGPVSRPGVLRILDGQNDESEIDEADAALVAFQERYDISARIEFDRTVDPGNGGTWVIKANTLADLTKREHRYEHHGHVVSSGNDGKTFPFNMMSAGNGMSPGQITIVPDDTVSNGSGANIIPVLEGQAVQQFDIRSGGTGYIGRPFAHTDGNATARVMVDEGGVIRYATTGLVPLGQIGPRQSRRGEDLMLSQALAFDVQVYDPEAPVYLNNATNTTLTPADAGYRFSATQPSTRVSSGAYVDLGYRNLHAEVARRLNAPIVVLSSIDSPFVDPPSFQSQLGDGRLTRVYDTWSLHYENNGIDEDRDGLVDEGTNGFDDPGVYYDANGNPTTAIRLGVDDPGEYETAPPYNTPLRAVQVRLRVYEPDSGQIREVTVRQHFVPE